MCCPGQVVNIMRDSGASLTLHIMDAASYKKAIAENEDLSKTKARPVVKGVAGRASKPMVKSVHRSFTGELSDVTLHNIQFTCHCLVITFISYIK